MFIGNLLNLCVIQIHVRSNKQANKFMKNNYHLVDKQNQFMVAKAELDYIIFSGR
jgi:hypothetical protein